MADIRPLIAAALAEAGVALADVDAFAATAGPGLASSLLIGSTVAKALALARSRPFFAINHLEGHLLSPFLGAARGVERCVALVVSGGHTLLFRSGTPATTRSSAAPGTTLLARRSTKPARCSGCRIRPVHTSIGSRHGESRRLRLPAFDAPGRQPAVQLQRAENSRALCGGETAEATRSASPRFCASIQAAIVEVLVAKTLNAARLCQEKIVAVSGGVSMNSNLRAPLDAACSRKGLDLRLAAPTLTTDNAAMIAHVAGLKLHAGLTSELSVDIDPNLPLDFLVTSLSFKAVSRKVLLRKRWGGRCRIL